jgi:hypothetical protein
MTSCCASKNNSCSWKQFQEAIDHCRWSTVLRTQVLSVPELQEENLKMYKHSSFEEIFTDVLRICKDVKGIGLLSVYDISADICRYNGKRIDRVYIIGNGPKRAVKLLNMSTKTQNIAGVSLKYVSIADLVDAFTAKGFCMDASVSDSDNGDDYETYICNWQKNV